MPWNMAFQIPDNQVLSLFVTIDDTDIEIEPYEEIVDRAEVYE